MIKIPTIKLHKLCLWIVPLTLVLAINTAYSAPDGQSCLPFAEAAKKADEAKQIGVVLGNLAINSEEGLNKWRSSKHEVGGSEMTGEELDNYMANMRDPATQKKIADKLRQKGVSEAQIQKGQQEMQEYIDIKTQQRKRIVTEKIIGVIMMGDTTNQKGYMLFADGDLNNLERTTLCRREEFHRVIPYQFKGKTPSMFSKLGNLNEFADYFKSAYNYGAMASGLTADYQTAFVILGNPETGNGVILKGTIKDKTLNFINYGNLTDVRYGTKLDQSKIPAND